MTRPVLLRRLLPALVGGLLAFGVCGPAFAKRVALIVGIGQYAAMPAAALAGPEPDALALRDVLVRRWGFNAADVRLLVNAQASRAAILTELRALLPRTAPGDEVLVYFSGHGTSALDAGMQRLALPHGTGAFVPADAKPDASLAATLIVGKRDLVPIFSALDAGERRLWVISDSCFSGQQVRAVQIGSDDALPARMLPLALGAAAVQAQRNDLALAAAAPPPEPYPYKHVAYLAASAEGEKARDIPVQQLQRTPTLDGRPHGALTDALLRVLEGQIPGDLNGDGVLTLNEVHRAVSDFMGQRAYGHTPQRLPAVADDALGVGNAAVLGARGVAAAPRQPGPDPLRVALGGVPPELVQALRGVPEAALLDADASPVDLVIRAGQGRVVVLAPSGDLLAGLSADDARPLVAQVRQLAWAKRLRQLAERYRRGALQMDIDPAAFGGNFPVGRKIAFVVRPDRAATLLLANISSDGKVSVLYPARAAEANPLPAGQAVFIPGSDPASRIVVQEPFGMDFQFAFAFDERPPNIEKLFGAVNLSPDDGRLGMLEAWLQAQRGRFTFATTSLRTLKP